MIIDIKIPNNHKAERLYILSILMKDYLGFDIRVEAGQSTKTIISLENEKKIYFDDSFFSQPESEWLKASSLPIEPCKIWNTGDSCIDANLLEPGIPIIYGKPLSNNKFFSRGSVSIELGLDLFGSSFFMLSRYEEAIKKDSFDQHDRFSHKQSLAFKENFLHRPIINEYLEILWACMKHLCPELERNSREFRFLPSHDVDVPTDPASRNLFCATKHILFGDIFKRKDYARAKKSMSNYIGVRKNGPDFDHYNNFDRIMDLSEKNNFRSTFNFISNHTAGTIDGFYSLDEPFIRGLLKKIHHRGHEIGAHPSYNSYNSSSTIAKELKILKSACIEEKITQTQWGGRQHFLRFRIPDTFIKLDKAGFDYDNSMTYAGHAGFRCGICYEYPAYNLIDRKSLQLRVRPLIAMDGSVLDEKYMGLGSGPEAYNFLNTLRLACNQFSGDFTLLWHNSRLIDEEEIKLYESLLNY
jgi:hypothetical protein